VRTPAVPDGLPPPEWLELPKRAVRPTDAIRPFLQVSMVNFGATCWLNSLVQLMRAAELFAGQEVMGPMLRQFSNQPTKGLSLAIKSNLQLPGNISRQEDLSEVLLYSFRPGRLIDGSVFRFTFKETLYQHGVPLVDDANDPRSDTEHGILVDFPQRTMKLQWDTAVMNSTVNARGSKQTLKKTKWTSAPKILLVMFKRFAHDHRGIDKNTSIAAYQPEIDFMVGNIHTRYVLVGIVQHTGDSLHDGHYLSAIRFTDNLMVLFNDEIRQRISEKAFRHMAENAYQLMYVKKDDFDSMQEDASKFQSLQQLRIYA
jgi:hypothetical protein